MRIGRRLLLAGVVVILWEAVRRSGLISPLLLAGPSDIAAAFLESGWDFLAAFQVTLLSIVVAIAIAWSAGIVCGVVVGASRLAYEVAAPILTTLFAIPLITLYPILMVWFGIGPASKIAFAVLTGFFPIALNTMDGVHLIDTAYIRFSRSIGATRRQAYLHLYLPLAMPSIMSGLRIGTSLIVIGVVVTEMLASVSGLGFWISYNRTLFNTGHVYLGITLAMVCVIIANLALKQVEQRFRGSGPMGDHGDV